MAGHVQAGGKRIEMHPTYTNASNEWLGKSDSKNMLIDMLNARDGFFLASSEFITYRCTQIDSATEVSDTSSLPQDPGVETGMFRIPDQSGVYGKIFLRLPHIKNRCAIARHAQLSNAVNQVAAETGQVPKSSRQVEVEDDLVRDVDLEYFRGHSPFINFIEAFVRLATSCREAKDDHRWDIFWNGMLQDKFVRWTFLLERAIAYLELAFTITTRRTLSFDIRIVESQALLHLFTALLDVLETLDVYPRFTSIEDIKRCHELLYDLLIQSLDPKREMRKHEAWHKESLREARGKDDSIKASCVRALQRIIPLMIFCFFWTVMDLEKLLRIYMIRVRLMFLSLLLLLLGPVLVKPSNFSYGWRTGKR